MSIRPFLHGAIFEPDVVRAMDDAFDSACRIVRAADNLVTQEGLAEKIIAAAANGERDRERLRDIALRAYGIHR